MEVKQQVAQECFKAISQVVLLIRSLWSWEKQTLWGWLLLLWAPRLKKVGGLQPRGLSILSIYLYRWEGTCSNSVAHDPHSLCTLLPSRTWRANSLGKLGPQEWGNGFVVGRYRYYYLPSSPKSQHIGINYNPMVQFKKYILIFTLV